MSTVDDLDKRKTKAADVTSDRMRDLFQLATTHEEIDCLLLFFGFSVGRALTLLKDGQFQNVESVWEILMLRPSSIS
jgi:hypothetical protein